MKSLTPVLLGIIQQSLGINHIPTCADMLELVEIHLPSTITTVEPLQYAYHLETITIPLDTEQPLDFTPLALLEKLKNVTVTCTQEKCDFVSLDLDKNNLEQFTITFALGYLDNIDFLVDWGCETSYSRTVKFNDNSISQQALADLNTLYDCQVNIEGHYKVDLYNNDFEAGISSEWSNGRISGETAKGNVLGNYGTETASLN
ncbi:MAG: hypothetical protein R2865_01435 [Deinococcales bacterium]